MNSPNPETTLDQFMARALEGDEEGVRGFFQAFLEGPLFVPERVQEMPLSHEPKYENAFLNILGVQDQDRVVVPAFSQPEYIEEWARIALKYRTCTGTQLCEMIPAGWWLCVNPGAEVEKEISPWEINLLRGGSQNLGALVEEIRSSEDIGAFHLYPIEPNAFPELRANLIRCVSTISEVKKLYLLKGRSLNFDENPLETLIVGVELGQDSGSLAKQIREQVYSVTSLSQIGGEPFRVLVASPSESSLTLGLLRRGDLIYVRELDIQKRGSIVSRILGRIKTLFSVK